MEYRHLFLTWTAESSSQEVKKKRKYAPFYP